MGLYRNKKIGFKKYNDVFQAMYWKGLPSLIFGLAAVIAALVTCFVPDVSNESLPDTVEQAEGMGTTKKTYIQG